MGNQVLVVGPGGAKTLSGNREEIGAFLTHGGRLLGIGLTEADADAILPFKVQMKEAEHISTFFAPPKSGSLLAGVGPADVHNRAPRSLPLLTDGAKIIGDGVLAVSGNAVFCQMVPWQVEYRDNFGLKRTYRRTAFLVSRLLANMGVSSQTPLLVRFSKPMGGDEMGARWTSGFYLDQYEEMDDPYRFFRW